MARNAAIDRVLASAINDSWATADDLTDQLTAAQCGADTAPTRALDDDDLLAAAEDFREAADRIETAVEARD